MKRLCLLFAVSIGCAVAAPAQLIDIRLSFKAVLSPVNAQRSRNFTDAQIDQAVARMNEILLLDARRWVLYTSYSSGEVGRTFRFVRVEPVLNIGQIGDPSGPSRHYSTDFHHPSEGEAWKDQMEVAARNDARYSWRGNAVNIYLTDGICGGVSSYPEDLDNIIILGGCSAGDGEQLLHELGHYFGLYDTQGRSCRACGVGIGYCTVPGSDMVPNTLPDLPCWGRDEIAMNSYGQNYDQLDPADRDHVDDTFFNVMSLRGNRTRFHYEQMIRWCHAILGSRQAVTSGRVLFTSAHWDCIFQTGAERCDPILATLGGPFASIANGVGAANPAGGDVLMLRGAGVGFTEQLTISKPLTLRVDYGPVSIGRRQ